MSHVAHPKISVRTRTQTRARAATPAAPLAEAAATPHESLAAPLLLAAIVAGDLVLAVTVAVAGALAG